MMTMTGTNAGVYYNIAELPTLPEGYGFVIDSNDEFVLDSFGHYVIAIQ